MSWSIKGANHLSKLLAERASGRLYERIDGLLKGNISEDKLQEIVDVIPLSAAKANMQPQEGKYSKIHTSPMPFEGQSLTQGMKAIRNLVENRISSELIYR